MGGVRVIGEYTTQDGPLVDDWFVVFVLGEQEWVEVPCYAGGVPDSLRNLGSILGTSLELGLQTSTDFASQVLWPPSLAMYPLFEYRTMPAKGIGRLFWSWWRHAQIERHLSREVVSYLTESKERAGK